jgi:tRNA nucleotidyltransferase (CCA-adding enzyme)
MSFKIAIPKELTDISNAIECEGGTVNLTGGVVRDAMAGSDSQDWDCEVFGLTAGKLVAILDRFGKVSQVGKAFGVIKVKVGRLDFDFTLPRKDNQQGKGHKGFLPELLPDLSPKEAAARRDFTCNSAAFGVTSGKLVDPFGAQQDIENKILRATSDKFEEDGAVRVLRGFKFAARLGFTVEQETAQRAATCADGLSDETKDRIWGEWLDWATNGDKLSMGIEFLVACDWHRSAYPLFGMMQDTQQDAEFHPEGDVLKHTKSALDVAKTLTDDPGIILAVLIHDMGKVDTTTVENGRIISRRHAQEQEKATRFLDKIGTPKDIKAKALVLASAHMDHLNQHSRKSVARLATRLASGGATIDDLMVVIEADHSARGHLPKGLPSGAQDIARLAAEIGAQAAPVKPHLMGRHLLAMGMEQGPAIGDVIRESLNAQLEGKINTEDEAIEWARSRLGV